MEFKSDTTIIIIWAISKYLNSMCNRDRNIKTHLFSDNSPGKHLYWKWPILNTVRHWCQIFRMNGGGEACLQNYNQSKPLLKKLTLKFITKYLSVGTVYFEGFSQLVLETVIWGHFQVRIWAFVKYIKCRMLIGDISVTVANYSVSRVWGKSLASSWYLLLHWKQF